MDTILTVNAGSSSLKFRLYRIDAAGILIPEIKGQVDGIGTRPRFWQEFFEERCWRTNPHNVMLWA